MHRYQVIITGCTIPLDVLHTYLNTVYKQPRFSARLMVCFRLAVMRKSVGKESLIKVKT